MAGIRNIEAEPIPPSWEQFRQEDGFLYGRNITDLAKHDFATAFRIVRDYAGQIPKQSRPTTLTGLMGLVDWATPQDRQQFMDGAIELEKQRQANTPPHI